MKKIIWTIHDFKEIKSQSKKYQLLARHLESLAINSDLTSIIALENDTMYQPYIKYIGGIGGSRALQFCVSKVCNEVGAIKTIDYIVDKLKNTKKQINQETIICMLNVAIMYEKEKLIDYILDKKEFKNKINFSHSRYMIVKNMTRDTKEDKSILRRLIVDKVIPLDETTRKLIRESPDGQIQEIVNKIDLKDKIEMKLVYKKTNNKIIDNKNKEEQNMQIKVAAKKMKI